MANGAGPQTRQQDGVITLENALRVERPELGPYAPVALFRLVRLVALEAIVGRGASGTFFVAGKRLGESLGLTKVDEFLKLCDQLSIGKIDVIQHSSTHFHIDVRECVTCSGMAAVGRPICHFEGGLISGALKGILQADNRTREVTCIGGLGDQACGFDIQVL
ncbi:MAG: V4R domain-containing protein [Myxococcota bacterium]